MTEPTTQVSTGSSKPTLIYILGAPGAGKGTLCKPLPEQFTNVWHLSVGDYLRDLLEKDPSEHTAESFGGMNREAFSRLMQQRRLLAPKEIVLIVHTALKTIHNNASTKGVNNPIILVDGFPRSFESAILANDRWGMPDHVLSFDCPRRLAEARFLNRKRSPDDNAEVFRARCDEFERLNGEIVEVYRDIIVRVDTATGTKETWDGLHDKFSRTMEELGAIKREVSQET